MSLWRTLKDNCGSLYKFDLRGFWGIDLDTKNPQIPNLPILTASGTATDKSVSGTLDMAGALSYLAPIREEETSVVIRRRRQFIPEAVEYVVHHNGPDNIPIIIALDDEGQFPIIVPLLGKDPEQMTYKEFIAYREWQESGRR